MDLIAIRNLKAHTIIGTKPRERLHRQAVIVDILLHADLRRAAKTDELAGTPDYAKVADQVLQHIRASRCRLVERLAGSIAEHCLRQPAVRGVDVTVTKPGALGAEALVSITVRRSKRK